jgi:hypothetical protein
MKSGTLPDHGWTLHAAGEHQNLAQHHIHDIRGGATPMIAQISLRAAQLNWLF